MAPAPDRSRAEDGGCDENAARALRLLPMQRPPAAGRLPDGRAHRGVDHRQRRGVGHRGSRWPRTVPDARPRAWRRCPDVPNWAWHEYGMRVGFWRLLDALAKRKIRATTAINARVCQSYEPRRAGDARRGLGVHGPRGEAGRDAPLAGSARGHPRVDRADPELHRQGPPSAGSGPASPRRGRPSTILAEEGIKYVSDWVNDDQPYPIPPPPPARSSPCRTRWSSTTSR